MKKNWILKLITSSVLLLLVVLHSCKKHDLSKIAGASWDPNLAVPIGYADFGVYDILASQDSNDLVINPIDGEISLYYNGEIASISAQSVVELDDYSQQFNLIPADLGLAVLPSFNGTIQSSNSENLDFPTTNGVELHELNFQSGDLTMNVSTTLEHDITLNITFLDLSLNSAPITRTINLTYGGSVPQTATSSINLANVLADFTAGGSAVNRIRIDVDATITGTGQPITGSESLNLSMNLSNLEFKNVTGYFGQQVLSSASDSILLKIFNSASEGEFAFTNPSINFLIENSFGIPIDMNFTSLQSINAVSGQILPLTGFPSVLSMNTPSGFGQTISTSLLLNADNTTNINTIISPTPKYLKYSINATSNPDGNVLPLNFIESTSKFVLKAELKLPMEGYASGFVIKDTMPFSFNGNVDNIESAMFRFNVNNGFPVSFDAQALFVDENYVPLFTLFDVPENIVSAGAVDNAGKVTTSTAKVTDITIAGSKTLLLNQVKHVIIIGTIETTQPQNTTVKFYDSYRMALKLGMQVQMKGN